MEDVFVEVFKICGGLFVVRNKFVVVGFILDFYFDVKWKWVLGYVVRGRYDLDGLLFVMFGSYFMYVWFRFMDEIFDCLLDIKLFGDLVDGWFCFFLW